MKLIGLIALGLNGLIALSAGAAPNPWRQPAAALAGQIAEFLGPGQAHLTIRNLSSISDDQIPAIQQLLEQELEARGVVPAGADAANAIQVTLSESAHERLWVAEVIEGDETQVAMVDAGLVSEPPVPAPAGLTLRKQQILTSHTPILAAIETPAGLAAIEPEQIAIYGQVANEWRVNQLVQIGQTRQLPRDPRAIVWPAQNGQGFDAWLAGIACTGSSENAATTGQWTVDCHQSDDPWIISEGVISEGAIASGTSSEALAAPESVAPGSVGPGSVARALPAQLPYAQAQPAPSLSAAGPALKAFYTANRDYFTGILVPNPAVELPPFYSAALIPRPAGGDALLIGGIDGKVQLLENGALAAIDGARDWGSDFAAFHSGCGPDPQIDTEIVASGSGEAMSDSLRAYDLPALEAVPASAPLAMNGTVMALWTAPDGKSLLAVVRDAPDQYEVDRVTASCN
ncbi:MAG: hypothetical protein ACRD3N_09655 [Terracidiphilus sp.]